MRAVLFDIDNTLLIKRPTIAEKWYEVLNAAGYAVSAQAAQRAFVECEMWVGEQIRRENETGIRLSDEDFKAGVMGCCLSALGVGEETTDMLAAVWVGKYDMEYALADGALRLLERLSSRGIRLGIVSNNRPTVRETIDDMGLTKYFGTIVISEEVGLYKPDPRILHYGCDKLNVIPEETLYVGDHPFDVVCAHDASVKAAWIPASEYMQLPEGVKAPLFRLNSLDELMELI